MYAECLRKQDPDRCPQFFIRGISGLAVRVQERSMVLKEDEEKTIRNVSDSLIMIRKQLIEINIRKATDYQIQVI